jgi:hypothetical protein
MLAAALAGSVYMLRKTFMPVDSWECEFKLESESLKLPQEEAR